MTKSYSKRSNAQRAARAALKDTKAVEGADFVTYKAGAEWHWRKAAAVASAAKPKAAKPIAGKRAAVDAAKAGKLPTPPDFSKPTHARFRKTLDAIVAAAKAGDIKALKADKTEPKSSSRVALCRYRDLCIVALSAAA
jgi:hypothetical protein